MGFVRFFRLAALAFAFFATHPSTLGGAVDFSRSALASEGSELAQISARLEILQKRLFEKFGIRHIYIGGGSSRAVLDEVFTGSVQRMRDLDVFIVADRPVTKEWAEEVGRALETEMIGELSLSDLRPRPRGPKGYNAGYGFFFKKPGQPEVDLSIYHSEADLKLNGIFDIDRTMIRLGEKQTLVSAVQELKAFPASYEKALKSGLIVDAHEGYRAWRAQKISIASWDQIINDPVLQSIRVVRSYSKAGYRSMPGEVATRISELVAGAPDTNRLQIVRNLAKLLEDADAARQLKFLAQVEAFAKVAPGFHQWLKAVDETKLAAITAKAKGVGSPVERFLTLLDDIPPVARLDFVRGLSDLLGEKFTAVLPRIVKAGPAGPAPKIGYFTGEFGPFHKGHRAVVEAALDAGKLDFVFVVPSPLVTNDRRVKQFSEVEWQERVRFSRAGIRTQPRALVWVGSGDTPRTLPQALEALKATVGDLPPLTHISGADSLHRTVARGLLEKDPRPRIVVSRGNIPFPEEAMDPAYRVTLIRRANELPISSTTLLQEIASRGTSSVLEPEVLQEVLATKRYQKEIEDYRTQLQKLKRRFKLLKPIAASDHILIDARLSFGGLWEESYPSPQTQYKKLFQDASSYPGRVKLYIPQETPAETVREWSHFLQKHSPQVRIVRDYEKIDKMKRVRLVHSGVVNGWVKHNTLENKLARGQRLLVFSTPTDPLTPLLEEFDLVKIQLADISNWTVPGCISIQEALPKLFQSRR